MNSPDASVGSRTENSTPQYAPESQNVSPNSSVPDAPLKDAISAKGSENASPSSNSMTEAPS
ncbi:hypothetical protein Ciccas_007167 [Cichlidogyrus casuarinus]|uniref:Uncharacterized protein n=1 Tax=Cichlidogyrus casuarinus TaxID=1844966 RepID=A0ABD2Q3N3_9PLAT